MSPELRQLDRTLRRWRTEIGAWRAQVSNGPTEATNNQIKAIKRIGFGFRRFRNYPLRVLLYTGHLNWDLHATATPAPPPPCSPKSDQTQLVHPHHRGSQRDGEEIRWKVDVDVTDLTKFTLTPRAGTRKGQVTTLTAEDSNAWTCEKSRSL